MGQNAEFKRDSVVLAQVMDARGTEFGHSRNLLRDFGCGHVLVESIRTSNHDSTDRYMTRIKIAMRATARDAVNIHGDGRVRRSARLPRFKVT